MLEEPSATTLIGVLGINISLRIFLRILSLIFRSYVLRTVYLLGGRYEPSFEKASSYYFPSSKLKGFILAIIAVTKARSASTFPIEVKVYKNGNNRLFPLVNTFLRLNIWFVLPFSFINFSYSGHLNKYSR